MIRRLVFYPYKKNLGSNPCRAQFRLIELDGVSTLTASVCTPLTQIVPTLGKTSDEYWRGSGSGFNEGFVQAIEHKVYLRVVWGGDFGFNAGMELVYRVNQLRCIVEARGLCGPQVSSL